MKGVKDSIDQNTQRLRLPLDFNSQRLHHDFLHTQTENPPSLPERVLSTDCLSSLIQQHDGATSGTRDSCQRRPHVLGCRLVRAFLVSGQRFLSS